MWWILKAHCSELCMRYLYYVSNTSIIISDKMTIIRKTQLYYISTEANNIWTGDDVMERINICLI